MKDKEQIMIDGCNVSGCENYRPKDRFTCYPYICNCHQKPDCYFKQLARKTQKCEELKAQLNDIKKEYDEYVSTHKYSNEEFQQERKAVADLAFWSNRYWKEVK